jgi:SHS2 domain-containing protein
LQGTLIGERLDPARHATKVLIKAVTYHGLEVAQREGVWSARIVFDI